MLEERFGDPEIGRILDKLQPWVDTLDRDSDAAGFLRIVRRKYEDKRRVPKEFIEKRSQHLSATYQAWTKARANDDFAAVLPFLERTLELGHEYASFFPNAEHVLDPALDLSDQGLTAAKVQTLFADLRAALVPLVQAISEQEPPDQTFLQQSFDTAKQINFAKKLTQAFGFDYDAGYMAPTPHPFAIPVGPGDVRIAYRQGATQFDDVLFATLHEAGHGIYMQGIRPNIEVTRIEYWGGWLSTGVNESQARLWENLVGRSYDCWQHFYPQLQATFPGQLDDISLDKFYRAVNKVTPSLIRVRADEVTYNLHIMIRFELEMALVEGRLAVRDLPDAWREKYQSYLGVTPPDDKDGVLQDVHWYAIGIGGYFQSYTLGNMLSAQFYDAAVAAHTEIPTEMQSGRFDTLHSFLRDNIYQHGSKYTLDEYTQRICGSGIDIAPYMTYLRTKYGALYDL
jgi:carboxypeptidase Taq